MMDPAKDPLTVALRELRGSPATDQAGHDDAEDADMLRAILRRMGWGLAPNAATPDALVADMYWKADDPERPECDPREHAVSDGLCPGEYFEVSRAVSLGNAWAVVVPHGDDDDIDCEIVETEDAAKRRCNEVRADLAKKAPSDG